LVIPEISNPGFSISPNPFSYETVIRTSENLTNGTLGIYNALGQEMMEIKNISGQEIKFQKDNLPNGIYFMQLMQDGKIIAQDKLIISD